MDNDSFLVFGDLDGIVARDFLTSDHLKDLDAGERIYYLAAIAEANSYQEIDNIIGVMELSRG